MRTKNFNRYQLKSGQSGATMVEYVMILGTLIATFVIIGTLIQLAAVKMANRSVQSVKQDVPCIPNEGSSSSPGSGEIAAAVFNEEQCY